MFLKGNKQPFFNIMCSNLAKIGSNLELYYTFIRKKLYNDQIPDKKKSIPNIKDIC